MNGNGNEALVQAQEMLAERGRLDITARRKLWQAMGDLEVREQDSSTPVSYTHLTLPTTAIV